MYSRHGSVAFEDSDEREIQLSRLAEYEYSRFRRCHIWAESRRSVVSRVHPRAERAGGHCARPPRNQGVPAPLSHRGSSENAGVRRRARMIEAGPGLSYFPAVKSAGSVVSHVSSGEI
jgi:hypothetical protein